MGSPTIPTVSTTGDITNYDWAAMVEQDLGITPNANDTLSLVQQMASENSPQTWTGTAGANNPVNNSLGTDTGSSTGSYPSLQAAAEAMAAELQNGNVGFGPLNALRQDANPGVYEQAIVNSNWSGSHYNGGLNYYSGTPPVITASQSASSGASNPVTITGTSQSFNQSMIAPGAVNSEVNLAASPTSMGMLAVYQKIDSLLNPPKPNILGTLTGQGILYGIDELFYRGIFALLGLAIAYKGFQLLTKGGSSSPGVIQLVQRQQSLSQSSRRLALENSTEARQRESLAHRKTMDIIDQERRANRAGQKAANQRSNSATGVSTELAIPE